MKVTTIISFILVLIGALVWLIVGIFDFNLITWALGTAMTGLVVSRIIYTLVGIAAIWMIFYWIVYNPFRRMAR